MSAVQSTGCYYTIPVDIANSEAEFFYMCRARAIPDGSVHPIGRGRDGSGAGWSIASYGSGSGGEMAVVTTAGTSPGLKTATLSDFGGIPGVWYTYHGAYKSGSYVKFGINGIWGATTAHASTTLRASSQGLSINRFNSANATGEYDLRFLGLATAVPTDAELLALHYDILELERDSAFDYGGLLTSIGAGGGGGGVVQASNTIWF